MDFKQKAQSELRFLTKSYKPLPDSLFSMYTMGIPASGKTSSAKHILEEMGIPHESIVFLDPDDVMSRLPGYKDSLKGNELKLYNRNAIIISSKVHDMFIDEGISFIYFGTGRGYSGYARNMRRTKKNGYTNVLINVNLDVESAVIRNSLRTRSVGRSVIESISAALNEPVKKTSLEKRLEAYMKLCDFGYNVDTSTKPPEIDMIRK
tara:strand:- start:44 stop:664 length:621 start_codon:yes stop_codon:yes gene_type:complete